jgi:PadR family transcriptional regulator, regulatory protein PadR
VTTADWPSDWLRGALSLAALGVLAGGPNHGYAIAQQLAVAGLGTVKGGTLYPLLTRLEADGLLTSSWLAGDGGPGRKQYALTAAGRLDLVEQAARWRRFTEVVGRLTTIDQEV